MMHPLNVKSLKKQLREYVRELNREWKSLDKEQEKFCRYAPPVGEDLKQCKRIQRKIDAIEKKMNDLLAISDRIVISMFGPGV